MKKRILFGSILLCSFLFTGCGYDGSDERQEALHASLQRSFLYGW